MSTRRGRIAVMILLLAAAACGSAPADRGGVRTFHLGLIEGAPAFVDFVMERHGILGQFGLKAERVESLAPANLHRMLAEHQVDIGFAGFTSMAAARADGKDVIVIHGVFSPTNMVFAPQDSKLRSAADLKGKKLGVFGGPPSTAFAFLAVIAHNWYGVDLLKDVELVTAPGPELIQLLEKGDIDAALLGTTESIQTLAARRHQLLLDLSEEYRTRQGGRAPAHVTIATSERFAKQHPDVVKDYLKAYKATLDYVRRHPEVWDEYAASIQIHDPEHRVLLRERMRPNIVEAWDEAQIAVQEKYLQLVQDIVGDAALASVPRDLMRRDFSP